MKDYVVRIRETKFAEYTFCGFYITMKDIHYICLFKNSEEMDKYMYYAVKEEFNLEKTEFDLLLDKSTVITNTILTNIILHDEHFVRCIKAINDNYFHAVHSYQFGKFLYSDNQGGYICYIC